MATILPAATVKPSTENNSPSRKETCPAAPLTSAGRLAPGGRDLPQPSLRRLVTAGDEAVTASATTRSDVAQCDTPVSAAGSEGSAGGVQFRLRQQAEEDAMRSAYRILYRVGFTPWEGMAKSTLIGEQVSALFAREEAGRQPPFGRALDLGCGSGIWAVKLAARGWQVTGMDFVPKALRRARGRARQAGVELPLIEGDVTALRATSVGSGFRFLLDFGLFHDELTDEGREAMGREVSAVAAPGATLVMLAWAPARRRLLPRGASRVDIEAAYPAWKVTDEEAMVGEPRAPKYVRKAEPRFYRLRHE